MSGKVGDRLRKGGEKMSNGEETIGGMEIMWSEGRGQIDKTM